ncbi:MAG: ABC transporter substrate-binding protein [Maritimibacter sp.]|uniref:ABC transporter substrate-binding protein n=1 Tax=Maritimibacter sp. TaxID=2003363 RepID=UPI001D1D7B2B|nr:ABC transporter substrate-binding protein [Maritimibacter sp.]MBL6429083.1 ABC transporter substrate-binding protein [Maritimibacter sp.]
MTIITKLTQASRGMAVALACALALPAAAQDIVKVERSPVGQFEALFIGMEQGYFAEQNIELDIAIGASPDGAIAQLMNGDRHVAMTGAVPLTAAVANGLPIVAVVNAQDQNPIATYGLMVPADSDIQSIADLKGKKIGLPGIASPQGSALIRTLEQNGMTRDDVELVNLPFPGVLQAIEAGSVDAGLPIGLFYNLSVQKGLRELKEVFDNSTFGFPAVLFAANKNWADENADLMNRFIMAMQKANDYANANPDAVRAVDKAQTQLPPEYLDTREIAPFMTGFDAEAWDAENEYLAKYGFISRKPTPDEYIWSGAIRQ